MIWWDSVEYVLFSLVFFSSHIDLGSCDYLFSLGMTLTAVKCNLDLVTLNLVTTCDLVTILQRPFFNLLHKIIWFSDIYNLVTVFEETKSVAKSRLHRTFDLIGQREKKLQSSQFIELVLRPVFAVLKYFVDNSVLQMYLNLKLVF